MNERHRFLNCIPAYRISLHLSGCATNHQGANTRGTSYCNLASMGRWLLVRYGCSDRAELLACTQILVACFDCRSPSMCIRSTCACARAKPSSVPQCAGASEGDRSWKGAGDAPFHCVQYGFIIYIYIVSIVLYIHKYKRCLSGTRCVHS